MIFTQVGLKKGVKMWGEKEVDAIIREMKQFHDRNVVRPIKPTDITPEIKKRALGYLMFLKEKRSGAIKGRGCDDGRPHRLYKSKVETISPTASTASVFIAGLIGAKENREVAVVDIPGAFLQTETSDNTIIKIQGAIVKIMIKINPSWKQFIVLEGTKQAPTIYSQAVKALYSTVDAAKLFYYNLCRVLINKIGFKLNPYDGFVVNKIIDGR